jgi:hypothetical protein
VDARQGHAGEVELLLELSYQLVVSAQVDAVLFPGLALGGQRHLEGGDPNATARISTIALGLAAFEQAADQTQPGRPRQQRAKLPPQVQAGPLCAAMKQADLTPVACRERGANHPEQRGKPRTRTCQTQGPFGLFGQVHALAERAAQHQAFSNRGVQPAAHDAAGQARHVQLDPFVTGQ